MGRAVRPARRVSRPAEPTGRPGHLERLAPSTVRNLSLNIGTLRALLGEIFLCKAKSIPPEVLTT